MKHGIWEEDEEKDIYSNICECCGSKYIPIKVHNINRTWCCLSCKNKLKSIIENFTGGVEDG